MKQKYNCYSLDTIKKFIKIGQSKRNLHRDEFEYWCFENNYNFDAFDWILIGYENDISADSIAIETFYRIGEPIMDDYAQYKPSFNFAEGRPEKGVSVVTTEWLHSLKSIFFNTTDENIKSRGVYEIKGIRIPFDGGDNETLIYPVDYAKKTKIATRTGLENAVKNA